MSKVVQIVNKSASRKAQVNCQHQQVSKNDKIFYLIFFSWRYQVQDCFKTNIFYCLVVITENYVKHPEAVIGDPNQR